MKKENSVIVLCLAMTTIFSPLVSAGEEEFRVEGILYESANAAQSAAIVDGQVVKKGDALKNYTVEEVGPDFVRLIRTQTGEEMRLSVKAASGAVKPAPPPPQTASLQDKKPDNIMEAMKNAIGSSLNPAGMIGLANEVGVLAGLRQVYTAASAYYSMNEMAPSVTLEELVKQDMISDLYASSYKGYRFRVQSSHDGPEVYADPENSGPDRKYFMIDRHGMIRFEKGKPATAKSPAYNV